jgi:hypothetical protein
MQRLILGIILALGVAFNASAQISPQCYTTNGSNCIKVGTPETSTGAWGALPVVGTVSISSSSVDAVDVTGIVTVSNFTASALQTASTPTISTSNYTAGNCIGGFNAVTVTNSNGQTGFLTNFTVTNISGATPTLTVFIFDSQPTTSTCTDKSTFSISATDLDKLIATPTAITLAAPTSVTSPSTASLDFTPPRPFVAGGSISSGVKTIYYGIVTTAITPTTTNGYHIRIGAALN